MPIINVTSSASSKKEMEQLVQTIGNASDSVSSSSVFGKLNDIKNQFTQVWTPDKASKIDAAMTTRAPATTALSNTVWTNTRAVYLDKVNTNLDAKMTTRAPASTALSNTVWTNARAGKMDNLDAAISSRASANTALSNSVWTNARAAKVDNLDAKISTVNTTATNAFNKAEIARVAAIEAKNAALSSGKKIFTSNGTFVVPAGVTKIYVTACGGGGGGCCSTTYNDGRGMRGSGGGGAPVILMKPISVTSGQSIPITIGKGGKGGERKNSYDSTAGGNGTKTTVGSLVISGGYGATVDITVNSPGRACTMTGAIAGGAGGKGYKDTNKDEAQPGQSSYGLGGIQVDYYGGGGGGGSYGAGGAGDGSPGVFGGGGGGGTGNSSKAGDGGDGIVIIEW